MRNFGYLLFKPPNSPNPIITSVFGSASYNYTKIDNSIGLNLHQILLGIDPYK